MKEDKKTFEFGDRVKSRSGNEGRYICWYREFHYWQPDDPTYPPQKAPLDFLSPLPVEALSVEPDADLLKAFEDVTPVEIKVGSRWKWVSLSKDEVVVVSVDGPVVRYRYCDTGQECQYDKEKFLLYLTPIPSVVSEPTVDVMIADAALMELVDRVGALESQLAHLRTEVSRLSVGTFQPGDTPEVASRPSLATHPVTNEGEGNG